MTQSSRVPEFSVEEKLVKTNLITHPSKVTKSISLEGVVAELHLLYLELNLLVGTSVKIRDSVQELGLSLEDSQ